MPKKPVVDEQSPPPEVAAFVLKATQWLSSAQGQTALTETVRKTVETADRLRDAQRVDPKAMQEPITV
ncbi:MAG TPA: hypothetical protein VHQ47_13295 [Phycisphaerae bacterium]|jgi:hypothetical protein|nr:hypothetical protein [Phycisphaerae bacterium]